MLVFPDPPIFPEVVALQKWRLRRVLLHIDNNLTHKLSLGELAAVAGLSRMYFAHQFGRSMGLSPCAYVLSRRVEAARALLLTSDLAVHQIAVQCGFGSSSHLSTAFKRRVGTSPIRWRKRELARSRMEYPTNNRL